MQEFFLEWQSPEHHFDRKSADWYWILGVIVLAVAVLAFNFGNTLFGIFVLIAGITVGTLSYKDTKHSDVRVGPKGIAFGRSLFPYSSYRSFWIEEEHTHGSRILLHPVSNFLPLTIIPIADEVKLDELEELLSNFLEQEPLQESILHKWFDRLLSW